MALALTIIVFLTIALVVFSFGAAAYAPSSLLGSRLRALGWQKARAPEKPALKERLEQALDPFSKAMVLSRGIVGDRNGIPKIASPIYKQSFDLRTGTCLDDPTVTIPTYPVRVVDGMVQIGT